jgi:hypothetical protein
MKGRTYGWALLLSESDHRRETVDQKLTRLKEFKLPSARIVETVGPFQLVFGHQPYHIFLKLEAENPDALLQAFEALEEGFSHVDGFI